jgi:N-acyl homoserine lactone hydrolase
MSSFRSLFAAAFVAIAACSSQSAEQAKPAAAKDEFTLTRLDCGQAEFKDMNGFFSDTPGVYPPGPGRVVDSCYLIRHGKDLMLWDTGFPATATKDKPLNAYGMKAWTTTPIVDQLAKLGIKPDDITVVGISHGHGDHVGQASDFPKAKLIIGAKDFDPPKDQADPFAPWRGEGKNVELLSADKDIFGDGEVVAIALPGHTPTHMGLLVNLKGGPVLLSGDTYHSQIARDKRATPGFNTSKTESLASMDKFEALAKKTNAKVIIQHEPNDVAKLPAFPEAAK